MTTALSLLLALTVAQPAKKPFTIYSVVPKKPAEVDTALGKPVSVGEGGTFREYGTPRSAWYVTFKSGIAVSAVVTFRKGFGRPEDALVALGIKLDGKAPTSQNIILRQWERVGGFSKVAVKSTDGRIWETVEVTR